MVSWWKGRKEGKEVGDRRREGRNEGGEGMARKEGVAKEPQEGRKEEKGRSLYIYVIVFEL